MSIAKLITGDALLTAALVGLSIWLLVTLARKPRNRYRRRRGTLPAPRPECKRDYTHEFAGHH